MRSEKMLEDLASECGCFISSLRDESLRGAAKEALQKMPLETYTLDDCGSCCSYVFGQKMEFHDYGVLRDFLKAKSED